MGHCRSEITQVHGMHVMLRCPKHHHTNFCSCVALCAPVRQVFKCLFSEPVEEWQ